MRALRLQEGDRRQPSFEQRRPEVLQVVLVIRLIRLADQLGSLGGMWCGFAVDW